MTIDGAVLDHLTALSSSPSASPLAKAVVAVELTKLRAYIGDHAKDASASPELRAFYTASLGAAGGRGGRGESPTSIPEGTPIEPDLTFMPQQ